MNKGCALLGFGGDKGLPAGRQRCDVNERLRIEAVRCRAPSPHCRRAMYTPRSRGALPRR